nr:UDP-N-acetylmuramoyl-L-alanyl-D-glutamate--2,6-diaminopimelate ligase [Leptolyngbya sp. 7M]
MKGLTTNSHACQPGDVFMGMPGTRVDGGEFWPSAFTAGAIAAVVSPAAAEKTASVMQTHNACVIPFADMAQACAQLAAAFYDYPAQQLKLVGVTGTNGKTTTTHLIEFLLLQSQQPTALLGTLYARWAGYQQTAVHTTPFALELQQQLAEAVAAGSQLAVMEVSSHALAQGRVLGCPFEVAVFTNLTQDHLDYHKDLEDYFAAKALLFSPDYLKGRAIVNRDDPYGRRLIEQLNPAQVWSYSVDDPTADLWTSDLVYEAEGVRGRLHTPQGTIEFQSPLVGQFNLANLLAAVGAALHLGVDLATIAAALPRFSGVPGRMEQVQIRSDQDISVIVDYAHTPDSLENMLRAARPFIIAMGAFRGMFVNYLWIRANQLKEDGRFYEAIDLARTITKLQPRFPHVWVFHAWNLAYNISVQSFTNEERWRWVSAGIDLLRREAIRANPNDLLIHRELAWIFLHKIGGVMDDANMYYKRQLAAEWTMVLGQPPKPDARDRDLAAAIAKWQDWLRPVAEAPDTLEALYQAEPTTRDLVDRLRSDLGFLPDRRVVQNYTTLTAVLGSGERAVFEREFNDRQRGFVRLMEDPALARAWPALVAHLRKRLLIEQYNMDPWRMIRYTERFGPLDWRHFASHALYWSERGVEEAMTRWTDRNRADFDFVNAGRMVVQSLQELWRSGDLFFDFLSFIRSPDDQRVLYRASPSIHFMDKYGEYLNNHIARIYADGGFLGSDREGPGVKTLWRGMSNANQHK